MPWENRHLEEECDATMAVNDTWARVRGNSAQTTANADFILEDIPQGQKLIRVHGHVAVNIHLPAGRPYSEIESAHFTMGIYTTLTVGGTVLNPSTQSSDFAPPLQRWLWWEQMSPVPMPVPGHEVTDARQIWVFSHSEAEIDIKSQVLATTAVSLHLSSSTSHVPAGFKVFDIVYWFSILRSGL